MLFQWLSPIENALVKPLYKRYMKYSRPNKSDRVAIIRDTSHQIIACARIRPIGEYELFTGMLVLPNFRDQGFGHQLLAGMQNQFTENKTYIFSLPHLTAFYCQHGFTPLERAPNDIQQRFNIYTNQGKTLNLLVYKID